MGASFSYAVYGLRVRSEVPLPIEPVPADGAGEDVTVRRHLHGAPPAPDGPVVAHMPCTVHGEDMRVYRGPGGAWIWQRATGTFHVSPDLRQVDVYPEDGADERALSFGLAGPALLFIAQQRGCPALHAGAVVTEHGAVAFLGLQGQGKSTMTSAFLRRGAALLTDDALPLQAQAGAIYGLPGPPYLKLWRETALHALAVTEDLPNLTVDFEKKLLGLAGRYAYARRPARLSALYLLERYDPVAAGSADIAIRAVRPREALTALLAYTSVRSYLLPSEEARFLPLYARLVGQAPLRLLRYPSGFGYQAAVYARLMADLGKE